MAGSNSDDALLARLNALKKSTVSMSTRPTLYVESKKETEDAPKASASKHDTILSGGERSALNIDGFQFQDEEADKLLDDLLNDLDPEEQWTIDEKETKDVSHLASEAIKALRAVAQRDVVHAKTIGNDQELDSATREATGAETKRARSEEEEADDIIVQIQAEVELDRQRAGEDGEPYVSSESPGGVQHQEDVDEDLKLPSAPQLFGHRQQEDEPIQQSDVDEYLASRLAALSLPQAPSFSPTKKPPKITKSQLPKVTDEEIESWCIICNDNAALRCLGCDGDLYCHQCWNEGHRGPDVGFEEKSHRAEQYAFRKKRAMA